MNRKQKIIVSVVGITIVLLALLGLTYAYFLTRIQGNTNEKSISVTTADLKLVYGDGNGLIEATNIMPGTTLTSKIFTVENTGNSDIDGYYIGFVNMINTLTKNADLVYTLTCESSISGNTCNGIDSKEVPNTNSYIIENSIKEKEIQTYKLTVEYKETGVDQSDDMGKELSFKVDIFSNKNTIELTGNVINSSKNDYVVINSKEQTSEIVDGKYKFIGIEPDNHKISIKNRATTKNLSDNLTITKGNEQSFTNDSITIDGTSKKAEMDITISDNSITKIVKDVNNGVQKREYLVFISKECLNDSSCSGPFKIEVEDGMTLNDWLNSDYSKELKTLKYIKIADDLKGQSIHGGYCADEMNNADPNSFYSYSEYEFGYIDFVAVYSGDGNYSLGIKSLPYPNNINKMNDFFESNVVGLAIRNTHFCTTCLPPDTLIEVEEEDEKGKKKRKKKKIRDIKVGDRVVCINPYTHELDVDTVVECDSNQIKKHNCYDNWIFNDGTVITTVHRHRFYNIERQKFVYMDEWNIGECGYNINGEKIKLIEHQHIDEEIEHCTLFTEKYNNYFANGMLSGNRNSSEIDL